MPRVRPLDDGLALVRPMLGLSRADVLNYLAAMGQPFRDDATNADLRFTRNRIRHELLPLLKRDYSATVVESLLRLSSLAADAQRVVGQQVDELAGRCVLDRDPLRVTLRTGELAKPDPYLVRELFVRLWREQQWPMQGMNQAHWSILADLAQANDAPRGSSLSATLPGAIRAERRSDRMVLIAPQASAACQA
jgi:tRNA(Ile)-lysidine synthase